ncbi:hypothetical protein WPS_20510 [Vulcanimicrobium alpinum]|uniref:catalase n=1 Tax=Vulcanimicrobium alpinum TaxID=3016050 RepID=A0AAN1XXK9_UNVUL|nr:catalase-related domain-containing protein [Vulcanimicrobium alpinum]BDE06775.1 hypothetical protein WPS_20510 [Vulcanimicrobium alpinum]
MRASSFADHYSQATLFWNSQADWEKEHIVNAFAFELAKVTRPAIRSRVLERLANVDATLVSRVAQQLGMHPPAATGLGRGAANARADSSSALSLANQPSDGIRGRKVAILVADGADGVAVADLRAALESKGATALVLAPRLGTVQTADGQTLTVDHTIVTMPSVGFDAAFVAGGAEELAQLGDAVHFLTEAYKHGKAVAAAGNALGLLAVAGVREPESDLVGALRSHRVYDHADRQAVPA